MRELHEMGEAVEYNVSEETEEGGEGGGEHGKVEASDPRQHSTFKIVSKHLLKCSLMYNVQTTFPVDSSSRVLKFNGGKWMNS